MLDHPSANSSSRTLHCGPVTRITLYLAKYSNTGPILPIGTHKATPMKKIKRIKIKCSQCGKEFEATVNSNRKFCDRNCYHAFQRQNPEKTSLYRSGESRMETVCSFCQKKIIERQANIKRSKNLFCDKECYDNYQRKYPRKGSDHHQWNRIKVTCEICCKTVEKWPSIVKKYSHQFCGNECRKIWLESGVQSGKNNPAWKGGYKKYYGPNWKEQQRKVRDRDSHICQNCGKNENDLGEKLSVHHIIPFREFQGNCELANELNNLISVCRKCHTKMEWET